MLSDNQVDKKEEEQLSGVESKPDEDSTHDSAEKVHLCVNEPSVSADKKKKKKKKRNKKSEQNLTENVAVSSVLVVILLQLLCFFS